MSNSFEEKIISVFSKNEIQLSEDQAQAFYKYYKLLVEWNEKFNLTTILDEDEIIIKHFLDSSIIANKLKPNAKIIDVGAGAGFPSLPLKIIRPDLTVLMIDCVNKKLLFLQEVIKELQLKGISTLHSRAEDLAKKVEYRESFDYSVARAVASLNTLSEYCLPFVKVGGSMIAYKSEIIDEEIDNAKKAINILGGNIVDKSIIKIEDITRTIITVNKNFKTPTKYPRNGNKPRIMPL